MSQVKRAEFSLPYHKQGDDLCEYIQHSRSLDEALEKHACVMEHAAVALRELKTAIADHEVEIDADVHFIFVNGPTELIDELIRKGVLEEGPFTGEEEEDHEDEDMH